MEQAYSILHNHLSFPYWLFLLIVFIVTLAVCMVKAKRRWTQRQVWRQSVLISLLITYIFFILLITLIARTPADTPKIKLIPFWSWYEVIAHHDKGLLIEILLNVVLFVPVGILARLLGVKISRVAIFSLLFSLSIELAQYVLCLGLMEWDDVIHNTAGGCIGYLGCGYFMRMIGEKRCE